MAYQPMNEQSILKSLNFEIKISRFRYKDYKKEADDNLPGEAKPKQRVPITYITL